MSLPIRILIFLASLVWLVKSSDYFTEYSEKIWIIFGMSSFIIWATIVALGTSLPELLSGIYAITWWWLSEYVIDWAVGSNIANVLLIFGIWVLFTKSINIQTELLDVDTPFFFVSMWLFTFFALDGSITRQESIFLLAFIVIFIIYSIQSGSWETSVSIEDKTQTKKDKKKLPMYFGIILVSMVVLSVSAKYFIDSVLEISSQLGITSTILTLSVVALGTSLPEVFASMSAIRNGNHGIAIGNVFWSNTFNLTLITGVPAFFGELTVSQFTQDYALTFMIIVTIAAIIMTLDSKIARREWISMLLLYVVFISKLTWIV